MSDYRRYFVAGGTYFFTVVTHRRRAVFSEERARILLRQAISTVRAKYPFEMPAIVLLPEHLHVIWALPPGDANYSLRWRRIKEEFTQHYLEAGGTENIADRSRRKRGERTIWQRRFWEHTIVDERDFERHFDYIHYNPVKHGLVNSPNAWSASSFHRWAKAGVYEPTWGRGQLPFDDLTETAME